MELSVKQQSGGTTVVGIPSENLDAGNVKVFRSRIMPVLEESERVVIDMSTLNFVDSSGLGALIACLRSMNSRNGDLSLVGLKKPVRALFELMRMHRVFSIYNTTEDALRAQS